MLKKIFIYFFENNIYMNFFLKKFFIKYLFYIYLFIFFISFFESLVLINILIPSSFIMFVIGFFIGKKFLNFYISFLLSILGCIFGDIISYYIGIYYKKDLEIFKEKSYFSNFFIYFKDNTFFFIILSRFFGPLKSFIFFLSGMLLIPLYKIFIPNLFGLIL